MPRRAPAPSGTSSPEPGPRRCPAGAGRHRWYYCLFALRVSSAFFLLRWVDAEEAVTLLEITERAGTGSGRGRKCQRAATRGWGAAHTPGAPAAPGVPPGDRGWHWDPLQGQRRVLGHAQRVWGVWGSLGASRDPPQSHFKGDLCIWHLPLQKGSLSPLPPIPGDFGALPFPGLVGSPSPPVPPIPLPSQHAEGFES